MEKVLDGAHLLLSQHIEDHKAEPRNDLCNAFRSAIDSYAARIFSVETRVGDARVRHHQKIASPAFTLDSNSVFSLFPAECMSIGADDRIELIFGSVTSRMTYS